MITRNYHSKEEQRKVVALIEYILQELSGLKYDDIIDFKNRLAKELDKASYIDFARAEKEEDDYDK